MNSNYPVLKNPPIKEAIIQFLFVPSGAGTIENLGKVVNELVTEYPNKEPLHEAVVKIMLGAGSHQQVSVNGYKITSDDGLNIVQISGDRIAISKLAPYKDWGNLCQEALRVLDVSISILKPVKITAVSVRYINQFLLPKGNFEDYIVSTPIVPQNLPQGVASFYTNFKLPHPSLGLVANIQIAFEGIENIENDSEVPIILDVDVVKRCNLIPDASETTNFLEDLHRYKNDIFFGLLTDEMMKEFI